MIKVTIKKSSGRLLGFTYEGHADYADHGQDIVCAGVTAQLMMAYNGLEEILGIPMSLDMAAEGGYLSFAINTSQAPEIERAQVIMETLKLGLSGIKQQYEENITLIEEEV